MSEERIASATVDDLKIELVLYRLEGELRDYRLRFFSKDSENSSYVDFNGKNHAEDIENYFKENSKLTSNDLNHVLFDYMVVDNELIERKTLEEILSSIGQIESNVCQQENSNLQNDIALINRNPSNKEAALQQSISSNSSSFFSSLLNRPDLKDTVPNHRNPTEKSAVPDLFDALQNIEGIKKTRSADVKMNVESAVISQSEGISINGLDDTEIQKLILVLKEQVNDFEELKITPYSPIAIQLNCSNSDADLLKKFFSEKGLRFSTFLSGEERGVRVLIKPLKNFLSNLEEFEQNPESIIKPS